MERNVQRDAHYTFISFDMGKSKCHCLIRYIMYNCYKYKTIDLFFCCIYLNIHIYSSWKSIHLQTKKFPFIKIKSLNLQWQIFIQSVLMVVFLFHRRSHNFCAASKKKNREHFVGEFIVRGRCSQLYQTDGVCTPFLYN